MCAALFLKAILAEKKSSKMNLSTIIDPQLTDVLLWRYALTAQSKANHWQITGCLANCQLSIFCSPVGTGTKRFDPR